MKIKANFNNIAKESIKRNLDNATLDLINRKKRFFALEEAKPLNEEMTSILKAKSFLDKADPKYIELEKEEEKVQEKINTVLKNNNIDLDMHYSCNKCKDTGYINGKMCLCLFKEYIKVLSQNSNIPQNYKNATFDTSKLKNTKQQEIFNKLNLIFNQQLNHIENPDFLVYLICGDVGIGKTYFSCALANELIKKGNFCYYVSSYEYNNIVVDKQFNKLSNVSSFNNLFSCDTLIIDDLGTESITTDLTRANLLFLIEYRVSNKKLTVINSNKNIVQLKDIYGERFISRLLDKRYCCQLKYIDGDDLRKLN